MYCNLLINDSLKWEHGQQERKRLILPLSLFSYLTAITNTTALESCWEGTTIDICIRCLRFIRLVHIRFCSLSALSNLTYATEDLGDWRKDTHICTQIRKICMQTNKKSYIFSFVNMHRCFYVINSDPYVELCLAYWIFSLCYSNSDRHRWCNCCSRWFSILPDVIRLYQQRFFTLLFPTLSLGQTSS